MIKTRPNNPQPNLKMTMLDFRQFGWGSGQISKTQYVLLMLATICQAITILMTWQLWQIRASTESPNLPVFEIGQFPFGVVLIITLFYVALDPKRGIYLHLIVLLVASAFDQMRMQPEFLAIWVMMFACVSAIATSFARWFLVAMWLWAGIHKLLSPDWLGMQSWSMLDRAGLDGESFYIAFAIGVAVTEIVLGVAAIFKPRWAAVLCPSVHFGIVLFLSPLGANWNYSVIPWNVSTAIVGSWIMWQARSIVPKSTTEWVLATCLLIAPIGFYFGLLDHGYAHALYSENFPHGVITTKTTSSEIKGWSDLRVPFPNERRLLRQYFDIVGEPGDKLHLFDPRPFLHDQFFVKSQFNHAVPIREDQFFGLDENSVPGISYDSRRAILRLGLAGAEMKRRSKDSEVYAISFEPELFRPDVLRYLSGLKNIQEVQLANCGVVNADLRHLLVLKKLRGIGLDNTDVSDECLVFLAELPLLRIIEHKNTRITETGLRQFFGKD